MLAFVRQARCDAQGNFQFSGLADGAYFVTSTVTWEAPTEAGLEMQGGALMQRFEVKGGQSPHLILTD